MNRGYVKLWRKILDSGLIQHPSALQLFIYLMVNASWKPTKYATRYGVMDTTPGEVIVGRKKLAANLNSSEQKIRTALKMLADMKIISVNSTSEFSTITLINWDKYQSISASSTSEPTNSQPTANQQLTTDKEGLSFEPLKDLKNTLSADAESSPSAIAPKPKPASKERTPEEILLAAQVKEVRDYFWAEFKKLPGRASGPTYPTWKQFVKDEAAAVKQHGVTEMKRRTNNCLRSGYNPNPTYLKFIQEPDKWVELMEKRVTGPKGEYESKRGRSEAVPDFIAHLAKGLKQ